MIDEIARLKNELARLKRQKSGVESELHRALYQSGKDRARLVWAMDNMGMRTHSDEFVSHVLRVGGTGDYDDCCTFIDPKLNK